jgi:signal transduction histidine kinase
MSFPPPEIGLANEQRIIHKRGDCIWAESAFGQGATSYITLDYWVNYDQ